MADRIESETEKEKEAEYERKSKPKNKTENKNPHPASQLHADQTNNKLYLYEKTNTTNKLLYDDYYQGDFWVIL